MTRRQFLVASHEFRRKFQTHLHPAGLLTDLLVDLLELNLELLAVRGRHGQTGKNMEEKNNAQKLNHTKKLIKYLQTLFL